MKQTNLVSLIDAHKNLEHATFEKYLAYLNVEISTSELSDLEKLIAELKKYNNNIYKFDNFFVSYTIPQIGKEFDFLRLDETTILNIEVKRESTDEKIKKQLELNKHYLSFLGKQIYLFTYISDTNTFYTLDNNSNLITATTREVINVIVSQSSKKIDDFDVFFKPSDFLVSPFNSTGKFIRNNYFLTTHQENIKKRIIEEIKTSGPHFFSIMGKPGTGKTLLVYDIVKTVQESNKVLIIHCGQLNSGHQELIEDYKWNIIPAKNIFNYPLEDYQLIIVDEAQRIYPNFFQEIIKKVKKAKSSCLFSHDQNQTLRIEESQNRMSAKIDGILTLKSFELTNRIRTNKEVANFIEALFNKDKAFTKLETKNIIITYLNTIEETLAYTKNLQLEDWTVINLTPDLYKTPAYERFRIIEQDLTSHKVIGQEFDNIAAVIDENFFYNNNKLDISKSSYYNPPKMLYQNLSRARQKLQLIIFKNNEVLERCLELLN